MRMKSRLIRSIILAIIILVMLGVEWRMNTMQTIETVQVVGINQQLSVGEMLTKDSLYWVDYPAALLQSDMITDMADAIGQYNLQLLYPNTLLHSEMLKPTPVLTLNAKERIITVKCTPVTSNGWRGKRYDLVDLVLVTHDETFVLSDARVVSKFGEDLTEQAVPVYYSLVVSEQQAMDYYTHIQNGTVFVSVKH